MKKRILSVALCLVMLITTVPVTALAEGDEASWGFGAAGNGSPDYTESGTLSEAFAAANGNSDSSKPVCYVKLNTAVEASTAFTLNGKSMVLGLNDKTITVTSNIGDIRGIENNNGNLTVKNGDITVENSKTSGYCSAYGIINSGGKLTLNDCTIRSSAVGSGGYAGGISAYAGSQTVITDCSVLASSTQSMAFGIETQGTVQINSGSFKASGSTADTVAIRSDGAVTNMLSNSTTHGYYIGDELQNNLGTAKTVGTSGKTVEVKEIVHEHSWTYSASGATVTAICAPNDGTPCNYAGNTTLTIGKPALTTYGGNGDPRATFGGQIYQLFHIGNVATGVNAIKYQKALANGGWEDLNEAPTAPGAYKASIKINQATAYVDYTIEKATLDAEGTGAASATYGTKLNAITISGLTAKLGGFDVPGTWVFSGETVLDAGNHTQTATFIPTSNPEYYETLTKDVTFTIAKADLNASVSMAGWTYGENASEPSVTGNDGSGDVTYTYSVKNEDNFVSEKPTAAGDYTVKAEIAETANYNGKTVTADFTIAKATVTIIAKDQSIYVGAEAPVLTPSVEGTHYTVTGLVGEDTVSGVTMAYEPATPDTGAAGTAAIKITGATVSNASNYNVVYTPGTLTISNRPVATPPAEKEHVCENTCDVCGKCIDADCGEDACAEKCNGDSVKFTDVSEDTWYTDAVEYVAHLGLMGGIGDSKFAPEMTTSRAMMVTILWRAAGCPEPEYSENSFVDVDADSYYGKAVQWAVEQGITKGISATEFRPDAECTRAQMVTFLMRAAEESAKETENSFKDVSATDYFAESVNWAVENGITVGMGDNMFSPGMECTRAQMATFVYRFLTRE